MKIGIIALGWLGKQLASALSNIGHEVVGSYAHEPKGLDGEFRYDINKGPFPVNLEDCDLVIFNLPPSKIDSLEVFKTFLTKISSRLIFVSSTSVYGQAGEVDESVEAAPQTKNGQFLLECEKLVSELSDYCVIRPGGLYGSGRHPAKFMSGKDVTAGKEERVNLISGKALTRLILKLISKGPKVVNAVNAHHPLKSEYYANVCDELGIPVPEFRPSDKSGKVVSTRYSDFKVSDAM